LKTANGKANVWNKQAAARENMIVNCFKKEKQSVEYPLFLSCSIKKSEKTPEGSYLFLC
jgi:hypothetical protein